MTATSATLFFALSLAFVFYRRFRRTFGRQQLARRPMIARMVLLSVVAVILVASLPTMSGIAAASAGALVGGALSRIGLAHTAFEVTPSGVFYTSNKWIGLGITAVFLGRVGARLLVVQQAIAQASASNTLPEVQRSPLTLGVYFLLAAYYVGYYAGLLRAARRMETGTVGLV